ncbi:MAG: winged helix-turn-helix transcriptional regulator, partial [Minisyncoccia bacterium]
VSTPAAATEAPVTEPLPVTIPEAAPTPPPVPIPADVGLTKSHMPPVPLPAPSTLSETARELLVKARDILQIGKQKKLDKIMAAIEVNGKITNNEVEKLVRVSDATATRYLDILEKQGRIKRIGMGRGVEYTKN